MLIKSPDGQALMVGPRGEILTTSTTRSFKEYASRNGDGYNIVFDTTLTSAASSALIYIKNQDTSYSLVLDSLLISAGTSTGGSGLSELATYYSPTGGTIISDATALTSVNRNAGNTTPISAIVYSGGTGKTATGGTVTYKGFMSSSFATEGSGLTLPNGTSIALVYTPPTGNTSQRVLATVICYFDKIG